MRKRGRELNEKHGVERKCQSGWMASLILRPRGETESEIHGSVWATLRIDTEGNTEYDVRCVGVPKKQKFSIQRIDDRG